MRFEGFSFGCIRIDGVTYHHDLVIDRGEIRKRKKKHSKTFCNAFGHTPLSLKEKDTLELSALGGRYRYGWPAGDGASNEGSQTAQN